ncbi:SdrD B-like domain-containing protein [Longimicrobium sp.]|uniref:SdrD B-like domain-containing protein n=1 Tax=Longimicrobium sp. TaxID=2029185 RepID=UPI002B7582D9|nr:SdrD B-like domain-containing protein [Longimicrobium sp.]HSU13309.1 SdrD B-like domain-containing protein [Longimicrobium sp.]
MRRPAYLALVAAAALAACESVPAPLEVSGTGSLFGFAYLDRNGSGALDAGDRPYRGLSVSLADWASGRVAATVTTDSGGVYTFRDVPVGRYRVRVDAAQLGDSVRVTAGQDSAVTVSAADSLAAQVRLALAYPTRTIAAVRALPAGVPVLFSARVVGLVGDTAFLWDGDRAIRAPGAVVGAQITSADLMGDSVRVVGRTGRAGTFVVLDSALMIPTAHLPDATPVALDSHTAAAAGAGVYDAAAVRVAGATILDTVTVDGNGYLRMDDGSGPLDVRLGPGVRFALTPYVPGVVMNLSGVLVPSADAGRWVLIPRTAADLEVTAAVSPFAPAVPTGVTVSALDSTVTLAWTDASTNETRFEVERRGGGTPIFGRVASPGPGVQTLVDPVAGNSFYGYRVRACNGNVCSAFTDEVTVATVPAAPDNLQAFPRTRAVQVQWRDLSRVEQRFEIQRKDTGGFADAGQVPGDVQTFLDQPLPPGVAETYRVRACNAAGCSAYSNEFTAAALP